MNRYDNKTQIDRSILDKPTSLAVADTDVQDVTMDVETKRQVPALSPQAPASSLEPVEHTPLSRERLGAFVAQRIEFGALVARFEGASARIVYANDDLAQWLGHDSADVEGTLLKQWLHTSRDQRMFLTPAIISETHFEQVSFTGPDGESLWANVHVVPHPVEAMTYACFVQDTKLKRELARELLYVQQMKQRHSIWRDVSRDVLNPLASVQSNLDYAMESFGDAASSPMPDVLEAIEDARQGLVRTIEKLQTLMYDKRAASSEESRGVAELDIPQTPAAALRDPTHSGIDILDPTRLSEFSVVEADAFNGMLDGVIGFVMERAPKRARIVKQIEPNIQADNWLKPEIEKVIADLLLYAHDMLRDGYDVEVLAYTHDTNVCLNILFVNDSRDGDDMLGATWGAHDLLGCHRTIMAKGGELSIEQDGPQQHISISLPRTVENAWRATSTADFDEPVPDNTLPEAPAIPRETSQPRATVMVIDDEEHVLKTISKVLSKRYEVVTATSIQEAMSYVRSHDTPDAFICDVLLAEGNGFEFYGELVKQDRTLRKRLLFMSGNAQTPWIHDTAQALKAPMLRKPFTSSQLLSEVGRLVPVS